MNKCILAICSVGQHAWLRLLSWLNQSILYICAGAVVVYTTNKPMVDAVVAKLPGPIYQLGATLAFASFVQFAIARAKKTGQ